MSFLLLLALSLGVAADATARTGVAGELHLPRARSLWVAPGPFTFGATQEELAAALAMCKRELAVLEQVDKVCVAEAMLAGEGPARVVYLRGFYLDRQEVSVRDYRHCVDAGRCDPRPLIESDPRMLDPRLPITSVSWFDADRYCSFIGGALPTELQWERAARGPRPRIFPWGDAPLEDRSNHGRFHIVNAGSPFAAPVVRIDERDGHPLLAPPGSFPEGASPDGFVDMAGNAMEWTRDSVGEEGPLRGPAILSQPLQGGRRMLRGGSFRQPLLYHRITAWEAAPPELRSAEVGFRCASERAIERR
jgi:formylglycine-generating enzyme required for sulfatase activity